MGRDERSEERQRVRRNSQPGPSLLSRAIYGHSQHVIKWPSNLRKTDFFEVDFSSLNKCITAI